MAPVATYSLLGALSILTRPQRIDAAVQESLKRLKPWTRPYQGDATASLKCPLG